jgi:hypothetical protein
VVVAGPRLTEKLASRRLLERPHRSRRCDPRQAFHHLRHTVACELVVTVPSLVGHDEEAAVDEAPEVPARRRASDSRAGGELARAQAAVRDHRQDELGTRRLRQERGRRGNVSIASHAGER